VSVCAVDHKQRINTAHEEREGGREGESVCTNAGEEAEGPFLDDGRSFVAARLLLLVTAAAVLAGSRARPATTTCPFRRRWGQRGRGGGRARRYGEEVPELGLQARRLDPALLPRVLLFLLSALALPSVLQMKSVISYLII
jgi:hypothetical protein